MMSYLVLLDIALNWSLLVQHTSRYQWYSWEPIRSKTPFYCYLSLIYVLLGSERHSNWLFRLCLLDTTVTHFRSVIQTLQQRYCTLVDQLQWPEVSLMIFVVVNMTWKKRHWHSHIRHIILRVLIFSDSSASPMWRYHVPKQYLRRHYHIDGWEHKGCKSIFGQIWVNYRNILPI